MYYLLNPLLHVYNMDNPYFWTFYLYIFWPHMSGPKLNFMFQVLQRPATTPLVGGLDWTLLLMLLKVGNCIFLHPCNQCVGFFLGFDVYT